MTKADIHKTETQRFSKLEETIIEAIHQSRKDAKIAENNNSKRIEIISLILGAIIAILSGAYVIMQLKIEPVEKRLDKIENKLSVMNNLIKSDAEITFIIDERIRYHKKESSYGKDKR